MGARHDPRPCGYRDAPAHLPLLGHRPLASDGSGVVTTSTSRQEKDGTWYAVPNAEEARPTTREELLEFDKSVRMTIRPRGQLADIAQHRIYLIRNVDRTIIRTLDELDETRREVKALTLRYINDGLEGTNEKQREASLAEALDHDTKYQELLAQERELHRKQRELDADRDCLRRMHHLELALLQGDRP